MKIVQSAGGIILNSKGEIALSRQRNSFIPWSLPKGHIEEGEDFLVAAKREIFEETGISDLILIKEMPVYERPLLNKNGKDDPEVVKRLHYFLFTTTQEDLKPIDPANPEAIWVSKDEVVKYLTHQKDKEFFLNIIDQF